MRIPFTSSMLIFFLLQTGHAQFIQRYPALPTDPIQEIVFLNENVGFFTNAAGSIFQTTNGGNQWVRRAHYQGDAVSALRFVNQSLGFGASPYAGLWLDKVDCVYTLDGGQYWMPVSVNLADAEDFLPLSQSVILKTNAKGIQRLDNFFGNWTTPYAMPSFIDIDVGTPFGSVHKIVALPSGKLLAVGSYGNARRAGIVKDSVSLLLCSTDAGMTWDTLWQGSKLLMQTIAFATPTVGWMGGEHESIFKTVDAGMHWTLQTVDSLSNSGIQKILAMDTLFALAVDRTGTLFRTTDGGAAWTSVIIEKAFLSNVALAFSSAKKGWYGGKELYATTDAGTTWEPVKSGIRDQTHHIQFITAQKGWVTGDSAFYASTDGGYSWSVRNNFSTNPRISSFFMIDSLTGWAIGQNARMKTTDGGITWSVTVLGSSYVYNGGVEFCNRSLGIMYDLRDPVTYSASFLVTSDGGNTWERRPITNVAIPSSIFRAKFTDPRHLWFANQQGLWLSLDTARTWTIAGAVSVMYSAFDMADSLTGYSDNLSQTYGLTTDGGGSWTFADKPYPENILDIAIIDPRVSRVSPTLMVGYDGTILQSQEGYTTRVIDSYTTSPLLEIAGYREGNTVHKWILGSSFQVLYQSYVITDAIPPGQSGTPAFSLRQNYPSPFNPSPMIGYTLARRSHVTLSVYNTLGQQVAALINENQESGNHEVRFDGSGLASGVYFYRIQAGDFVQTKRLILLR